MGMVPSIGTYRRSFPMKMLAFLQQIGEMKEEKMQRCPSLKDEYTSVPYSFSLKGEGGLFISVYFRGKRGNRNGMPYSVYTHIYYIPCKNCTMCEIRKMNKKRAPQGGANI